MSDSNYKSQVQANKLALRWYTVPGLVGILVALAWYAAAGVSRVPITGTVSIARVTLYVAAITGIISFILAYRWGQQKFNSHWKSYSSYTKWLDTISLTFAHLVVVLAGMAIFAFIFNSAFKGLTFDMYTASFLVGASVAISAFVVIKLALGINVSQLISVLAFVLIGGTLLVMITNDRPDWWQENFSYLGTAGSSNHLAFNITLITGGLVMLALTRSVFAGFTNERNKYLRWLFVAAALALAGVGFFPYTPGTVLATLHNISATSLVFIFFAMIGGLNYFVPGLEQEFLYTSYGVVGLLILSTIFWVIGYFNQTAFELTAFGLSFTWLILLLSNLQLRNRSSG